MRIFGIDCGTEVTGFGVVETVESVREMRLECLAFGGIRLSKSLTTAERLNFIFNALTAELERWQPDAVAIEEVFYSVNGRRDPELRQTFVFRDARPAVTRGLSSDAEPIRMRRPV